jgi:hypothetical protein
MRSWIFVFVVLAARLGAQGSFEGVITYQAPATETNAAPTTVTFSIKGAVSRIDLSDTKTPFGAPSVIMDSAAKSVTVLMPSTKMYMTTTMQGATASNGTAPPVTITPLGTTETVAGIKCENYAITNAEHQGTVCAAHGMGTLGIPSGMDALHGMPSNYSEQIRAASKDGFLPLKLTELKDATPHVALIATSVVRKNLDPSLFVTPSDYMKVDQGNMSKIMPSPSGP